MTEPYVAIIVLNWNNAADTLTCLASLAVLTYVRYSVLVVDNGSTDDSVARIHAEHPKVEVLPLGCNLGYAGGNNVGMRHVLARGVDYIWLLNDDITVAPDALSALVAAAEAAPDSALLGAKICIREDPTRILSLGGPLLNGWEPVHLGLGEVDSGQYESIRDVDHLSGCALLGRARAIERFGLLDEDFFAYHEDIEWCYRAKQHGWRVLTVCRAKVWHPDTRNRDRTSRLVTYYLTRNQLLFLRKHRLGWRAKSRVIMRNAVWIANWSVNAKWRHFRGKRDALCLAMLDYALGKTGVCRRPL